MATFLATIDYESRGHQVLLEVYLTNDKPEGATTREQVEDALRQAATTGVAPEGWTIGVLNWSHPKGEKEGAGAAELSKFDGLIRSAEVTIETAEPPEEGEEGEEE